MQRYRNNPTAGLKQHIIKNTGGNSQGLLAKVLGKEWFSEARIEFNFMSVDKMTADLSTVLHLEAKRPIERRLKEGRYGLVSRWKISPKWFEVGKEAQSKSGIWCFDGSSFDSKGRFIEFKTAEDGSKKEKTAEDESEKENFLADKENYDEDVQESGAVKSSGNEKHRLHAMVLLGYTKNKQGETLFVLLNTWKKMPLVCVSFDYMVACKCKVSFLDKDLPPDFLPNKRTCGLLAAECSHPDYVEEGYHVEDELDYPLEGGSSCC